VTVADALMLALGLIAVGSGALVVTSTHLVRAGLYLVISLGAVAGIYLALGAELVAWVQVLVYVGAVVVLLLFAVMLTRAPIGPSPDLDRPSVPAALIGAGVGFGLTVLLADAFHWTRYDLPPPGTAQRVGEQVFGAWVLPFEVLSILLLAALVGAVVLSRPDLGARPDPQAAVHPDAPAPDPVDESAEVVARLERIAARQAAAQARVRAARAEQVAADARGAVDLDEPAVPAAPADPLKDRARDVVFGARERRPRLGEPEPAPPETGPRVIEGTSRPGADRPQIEGTSRPAAARSQIEGKGRPGAARPQIEGTSRPGDEPRVIEGTSQPGSPDPAERRRVRGRDERPALPAKPAEQDEGTES
jgi:NADH:ubiquinone oxidoreductase subunit 6 (subunit J)